MEYEGNKGFWISPWLATRFLLLENDYNVAKQIITNYEKKEELFLKAISSYEKQQKIILGMSIAFSSTCVIVIGITVGLIVYCVLSYYNKF